jgi:PAS domain S-box-containing protein
LNLLSWGYVVVAAACVTVAVQHLMVAARLENRLVYVMFAGTALAAAVDALVQRAFLGVRSPAEAESFYAWTAVSICVFLISLIWFIAVRTGAVRRWLLLTVTALLVVTAAMDFVLPGDRSVFMRVGAIRDVVLPWGEVIRLASGTPVATRIVGDIANVAFLVLLLDTAVRLSRRGRRREAILIGGSLAVVGISVLAIIPTDLGLIDLPSMHPHAFLLIVAGMSLDLSDRVARATVLSREVVRGESRWRQLVDNAPLLMTVVGTDGKVLSVNPQYERVKGLSNDEIVGRHVRDLVPPQHREGVEAAFRNGIAGEIRDEYETELATASGESRTVAWRNVLLRDEDGAPEAILSLGADVTERRDAERARDEALGQLERSVRDLEALRQRLEEENLLLREEAGYTGGDSSIIGSSPAVKYVLHKVGQVASTGTTVLLNGETGVGKELVARLIHRESDRASGPFVAVNCAAIPPGLVESELFGHERGAFTGAERLRRGRFELATGGTLFLDEISELPLESQPKLLRVLQDGRIERVGAERTHEIDVRLIAATNRNLAEDVEAGRFRQDLFYRLEVYPVTIPPLRDRAEDIPELVEHFVRELSAREGIRVDEIPREVLRHLTRYDWPGNVRELQNVIERSVLRCTDGVLRLTDSLVSRPTRGANAGRTGAPLHPTLDELQRDYIRQVLADCGGRIAGPGGAAEILGIHPNTLRSRMRKLGIGPEKDPSRATDRPSIGH